MSLAPERCGFGLMARGADAIDVGAAFKLYEDIAYRLFRQSVFIGARSPSQSASVLCRE